MSDDVSSYEFGLCQTGAAPDRKILDDMAEQGRKDDAALAEIEQRYGIGATPGEGEPPHWSDYADVSTSIKDGQVTMSLDDFKKLCLQLRAAPGGRAAGPAGTPPSDRKAVIAAALNADWECGEYHHDDRHHMPSCPACMGGIVDVVLRSARPPAGEPQHGDCEGGNCYTCNLAASASPGAAPDRPRVTHQGRKP